ncbi:DUF1501 domain-containing protein [Inhella gelatinilytica]|uniref:DUF1501 domain-containing protein n=1 Tax=Inhella gelatinilytica TaxID=2795030 RepID=A0A931NA31_9BURK|nr:DUF1501 domain-containing protein [Inhella gelatinilytica]MBH9552033.1 DUF1501 domain-containing protein [Inhella gelatinilytica]
MALTRRDWLGAGFAACSLGAGFAPARAGTASPRWVVVLLRGAVDGLSVCAPYGDPHYAADRPSIALPAPGQDQGLIDLDGRFGLHPALAPLAPLWAQGELGFVHACGAPTSSRSHFEAQDELEAGTPGVKTTATGWMARLMGDAGRVRAVYTAPARPKLLTGGAGAVAALPGPRPASQPAAGNPRAQTLREGLDLLYAQDPRYAQAWAEARQGREQVNAALEAGMGGMNAMAAEMQAADRGAPGAGTFPATARRLAQVMRADASVQFAVAELGGWDTHARQGAAQGALAGRLGALAEGLAVLARELGPLWRDTVVTVVSEFGRTVRENGTGGTDHGHGNALWLLGGAVQGGRVGGEWPGLEPSARFEGRDLAITTDYRAVMAGVAARHLGLADARLTALFPGYRGPVQTAWVRG